MKISVLTPSFNSGKYLDRAIKSVIKQNFEHFEHIIVDGGSTDETLSVISNYSHLKWISEQDKGQSDAMNKAFSMSTGDIIVYLNADDEFADDAFQTILAEFDKNCHTDMVVGDLIFSDSKGTSVKTPSAKYLDLIFYWRNKHPYNPVSYFYKRNVQQSIGGFPLDNHYAMDIWFLLKAYQKFNISKVNKVLGTFYFDGNNKTSNTDVGLNLHNTVKKHLRTDNLLRLPHFYLKLIQGKFKTNKQLA